jgi:hypothetical protein
MAPSPRLAELLQQLQFRSLDLVIFLPSIFSNQHEMLCDQIEGCESCAQGIDIVQYRLIVSGGPLRK